MVYEIEAVSVKPRYSLFPHQRQVLSDIIEALSSPERRTVAHLPTGAGKTRIAAHAACFMLNKTDTEDSLIIWLASTEELCEQAAEELSRAWESLGLREVDIHRHWGNWQTDLRHLSSGFLVTGLSKLWSATSRDATILADLASCTSAVIFDEAHQAVAQTYSFLTQQLCSVRPPLLGLTATPGRTASLNQEDYQLAKLFNHKKVTIDPKGHKSPITFLIQNEYLADAKFIPTSFDSEATVPTPEPGKDYSASDLENLGRNRERTFKIVGLAEKASERHPRTIVFCPSVESAVNCKKYLETKGVITFVVTAETSSEIRRSSIDSFKSDSREHMVMFNYGVLTAGFDAPRTSCALIARPTTSLVLYSQMAGRALRGPRANGNRRAEIYTVVDTNLPGFGSVTDAFTNWEALWSNH